MSESTTSDIADRFVDLACLTYGHEESRARREEAAALLASTPSLVEQSAHAAAAAGDVDALRAHIARDATCVKEVRTTRGFVPLLALCYSRVPHRDAVACLDLMLAHGADPNAHVMLDVCRFTALTGVIGEGEAGPFEQPPHPQAMLLAQKLLDAGADPNESQALYNTHFLPSNEWLSLLLARGLSSVSDLDLLLGQAAVQGFTERVKLLVAHANVNGTNRYNGRTHLLNALLEGHSEIASVLEQAGAASPVLGENDRFRIAVLARDESEARRILAALPSVKDDPNALLAAARHGYVEALELGLSLGLPIDGADSQGLTALHHAARSGHLAVVQLLLARGASRTLCDRLYNGTPLGHARHFTARWPRPDGAQIIAILDTF